jgi:ribosome-interacting GTPase 1
MVISSNKNQWKNLKKKTQKNKTTEEHLGILKAKLAKLRRALYSKKKSKGEGFGVSKHGTATVALVGFPSSGKSTLLTKLTNAESKSASYAFTTTSVIPGMMHYKGADIQLLDLPGIVEGASEGLIDILTWSGIEFDEGPHAGGDFGPYVQSERLDIYKK